MHSTLFAEIRDIPTTCWSLSLPQPPAIPWSPWNFQEKGHTAKYYQIIIECSTQTKQISWFKEMSHSFSMGSYWIQFCSEDVCSDKWTCILWPQAWYLIPYFSSTSKLSLPGLLIQLPLHNCRDLFLFERLLPGHGGMNLRPFCFFEVLQFEALLIYKAVKLIKWS